MEVRLLENRTDTPDGHTYVSAARVLLAEDALLAGCLDWELIAEATGLSVVVVGMISNDIQLMGKWRAEAGREGGWIKEIGKCDRGSIRERPCC